MSEDEHFHQAGDEAMARRLKALACTAPLHQLDTRKTRLDWVDGADYQMAEIALQAIDQVTIAMDFDRGADQEQIVRRLLPFIAAQRPSQPDTEYVQVGNWVLENLINQQFAGVPQRAAIDLFGQLMTPCLELDIATAHGPTSTFFTAGAGLRLPSVVSLGGLVETLLLPPSERDPLGEPIAEPDLAPLPDTDRFTDEQWQQADALLDLGEMPRRLSGLLTQSRAIDPELPELVALRVLHAVNEEVA